MTVAWSWYSGGVCPAGKLTLPRRLRCSWGQNKPPHMTAEVHPTKARALPRVLARSVLWFSIACISSTAFGQVTPSQTDPASEPAVLAVAKVLPAVVNINTERVVRRQVRDPFDDFAAQFFGVYRNRPREIRQTLQSLGSGFLVDPAGFIVTNEHVVERAADLKIEVITNDQVRQY